MNMHIKGKLLRIVEKRERENCRLLIIIAKKSFIITQMNVKCRKSNVKK